MINEPSVDALVEKLGDEAQPASRYELCVVVAKRARQIVERDHEQNSKCKEIETACREIEEGRLTVSKD